MAAYDRYVLKLDSGLIIRTYPDFDDIPSQKEISEEIKYNYGPNVRWSVFDKVTRKPVMTGKAE